MNRSTTSEPPEPRDSNPPSSRLPILTGTCFALFAFDVGFQIDLDRARSLLQDGSPYRVMRGRRPAPAWFDYEPPPIRILTEVGPIDVGASHTTPNIEWMIYEFGAVLATYRVPFECSLDELTVLSRTLDDNPTLLSDARERVGAMLDAMKPAVERALVKPLVEDYVIFVVDGWPEGTTPAGLLSQHEAALAGVLQSDARPISRQQIQQTMSARMSYSPEDLAVIDWNGALVFDREPEDVVAVLQHANVELLELRVLDGQLDGLLDQADEYLAQFFGRRFWPSFRRDRMLRLFASVHTDAAVMFEGVNNAIKLLGNQYLARLYRLAAGSLDLPSWDASVLRKLQAVDSVYQKMADTSSAQRTETLEMVIVILIAVEIVMMIVPGLWH